jgi:hypothetical protein
MKSERFFLPGSRTELHVENGFNHDAAVHLLTKLQADHSAQEEANRHPDKVLKEIGVSVVGGVGNVMVTDLFGGLLRSVGEASQPQPIPMTSGFVVIILIIIFLLIAHSAK